VADIRDNIDGLVVLTGAGAAGAATLTAEGRKWLSRADVVIYDRLAGRDALALCRGEAEMIPAGKHPGGGEAQERINRLMVEKARAGKLVVRLKGGDPFVFGRGGEEAEALAAAGVPFRVVPGVTAGVAAAAYAGIPLTHRRIASTVTFVTGHEDPAKGGSAIDYSALARLETLVFYMSVANLPAIAQRLTEAGRAPETPAAIVEHAASPRQRTIVATLATVAAEARAADVAPPAVVIVGRVAGLRERLAWFEKLPLFGRTVLVTRSRRQSAQLTESLREAGACVIEAPAIEVRPLEDFKRLDAALADISGFDWLVLTSANGARFLFERLAAIGRDARALAGVKVAAIGPPTAEALRAGGITADLVPDEFTTERLGEAIAALPAAQRKRLLLARADISTPALAAGLTASGSKVVEVTLYRTTCPAALPGEAVEAVRAGSVDWITFTSASTVQNFLELAESAGLDTELPGVKLASIGPATSEALARRGLSAAATAQPHTADGLVQAIISAEAGGNR